MTQSRTAKRRPSYVRRHYRVRRTQLRVRRPNRRDVMEEEAIRRRSSEPLRPRVMRRPAREGSGEALTGARAGWAIEPRKCVHFRAPTLSACFGRQYSHRRCQSRDDAGPGAVGDPEHARKHLAREPGGPAPVCRWVAADRKGKPKGDSLR
jgi:hypothetical protein